MLCMYISCKKKKEPLKTNIMILRKRSKKKVLYSNISVCVMGGGEGRRSYCLYLASKRFVISIKLSFDFF